MPGAEYHNQAWLLEPEAGTLAMLGIHGQFALLNRETGVMMVGLSSFPDQANPLLISSVLETWRGISRELAL